MSQRQNCLRVRPPSPLRAPQALSPKLSKYKRLPKPSVGYDSIVAERKRYLLVWLDARRHLQRLTISPVRRAIEDQIKTDRENVEIDVWLDCAGGDAHAAYKLALMLRAAASHVRIVIPDFAKSAATLLATAGDEIFMGPGADLGPLDAQMPDEGSVSGAISALNIARAADEVARDAVDMAVIGGAELLEITGLSRAQTLEAMLAFSAKFSEPLVCQLDPKVVHHAKQMLQVTARYAEHLLAETGNDDPQQIAQALVETFPTHGYVISRDAATKLGLPIRPLSDYDLQDAVQMAVRAEEDGARMLHFGPIEDFVDLEAKPKPSKKRKNQGGGKGEKSKRSKP